jgi:hypothetical protein
VRACAKAANRKETARPSLHKEGNEQRGETSEKIVAWSCVAQYAQPFQELVHLSRGQGEEYNGRAVNGIHDGVVILIVAHSRPAPSPSFQFNVAIVTSSYRSLTTYSVT